MTSSPKTAAHAPDIPALKHIAVVIPLPYRRDGGFWERDAGLLVRAFRRLGLRSTLVALTGGDTVAEPAGFETDGLALGTPNDLRSPDWWKALAPDAVVLFGWGLHHFEAVREAFRQVTPLLAEHTDSDGMRSPLVGISRFWYLAWAQSMDRRKALHPWSPQAIPSALWATIWTLYCLAVSPTRGAAAAEIASRIPVLLTESPVALARTTSWLRAYRRGADNLHLGPHSIDLQDIPFPAKAQKKPNRVIAIGRWTSFQKNFPSALRVAMDFLKERPDYEFHFVGETPETRPVADRLIFHGRIAHAGLGRLLARSNILFASSRYESFHLAAGEALCSGCSVVLPSCIPTAEWFASEKSGTISTAPAAPEMLQALRAEASAWDAGLRDAHAIAACWRARLDPETQARQILRLLS